MIVIFGMVELCGVPMCNGPTLRFSCCGWLYNCTMLYILRGYSMRTTVHTIPCCIILELCFQGYLEYV